MTSTNVHSSLGTFTGSKDRVSLSFSVVGGQVAHSPANNVMQSSQGCVY